MSSQTSTSDPRKQAMLSAAKRVGLHDEPAVIQKALELERLLATKLTNGGNISDTCRNILCLDLAASSLDIPVDKVSLLKVSGTRKAAYASSRGAAEGLLQLRSSLTVAAGCVKMQCVSAQDLAERIIAAYAKTQSVDTNSPTYIYMAIYQACRIAKIKMSKAKLISHSGLKQTQWARLEAQWTKFVDQHFNDKNSNILSKCSDEAPKAEVKKDKKPEQIESYECWRKRILEEAYRELEMEAMREAALRKSPRKREADWEEKETTPQKSPKKADAVLENEASPRKKQDDKTDIKSFEKREVKLEEKQTTPRKREADWEEKETILRKSPKKTERRESVATQKKKAEEESAIKSLKKKEVKLEEKQTTPRKREADHKKDTTPRKSVKTKEIQGDSEATPGKSLKIKEIEREEETTPKKRGIEEEERSPRKSARKAESTLARCKGIKLVFNL